MNIVFSYGTLIDKFDKEKKIAILNSKLRLGYYGQYPALIKDSFLHKINGYIIELTDEELRKADYYEGYPELYNRVEENVMVDDKTVKAWVYILDEKDETKNKYSLTDFDKYYEDVLEKNYKENK